MDSSHQGRDPADGLFAPVDIAWLVYFRVILAAALLGFVFFSYEKGWNYLAQADDLLYFPHPGFGWLRPLPPPWMHVVYGSLAVAAAGMGLGLLFRASAVVALVAYGYVFFLDQTLYQNHLYLILLLLLMIAVMPANRAGSLDVLWRPALRRPTVPFWMLALLRFQFALVYFYGGLAKLNEEWLSLRSVTAQLNDLRPTVSPSITPIFDLPGFVALLTWGGLAFDLLIAPMLLWRRTRTLAFLMVLFFHVTNSFIFPIDIFPSFMLAATALFFPPDFPRRVAQWLGIAASREPSNGLAPAGQVPAPRPQPALRQKAVLAALLLFTLFQLLFPLRHYFYPGPVYWTGLGDNFSWQMRTVSRTMVSQYLVTDRATRRSWLVEPQDLLIPGQLSRFRTPDMHVRLAREAARRVQGARNLAGPVEVRAIVLASLNGGERHFLFDPNFDLSRGTVGSAARHAVLPLHAAWSSAEKGPRVIEQLQSALSGAPWPSEAGPFDFERRPAPPA